MIVFYSIGDHMKFELDLEDGDLIHWVISVAIPEPDRVIQTLESVYIERDNNLIQVPIDAEVD